MDKVQRFLGPTSREVGTKKQLSLTTVVTYRSCILRLDMFRAAPGFGSVFLPHISRVQTSCRGAVPARTGRLLLRAGRSSAREERLQKRILKLLTRMLDSALWGPLALSHYCRVAGSWVSGRGAAFWSLDSEKRIHY